MKPLTRNPRGDSRFNLLADGGIEGDGGKDYVCSCGCAVLREVSQEQAAALRNVAFTCPRCGSFLSIPKRRRDRRLARQGSAVVPSA